MQLWGKSNTAGLLLQKVRKRFEGSEEWLVKIMIRTINRKFIGLAF